MNMLVQVKQLSVNLALLTSQKTISLITMIIRSPRSSNPPTMIVATAQTGIAKPAPPLHAAYYMYVYMSLMLAFKL